MGLEITAMGDTLTTDDGCQWLLTSSSTSTYSQATKSWTSGAQKVFW